MITTRQQLTIPAPTDADRQIARASGVPPQVTAAMYVAAWSCVECMDLILDDRQVIAMGDERPSDALDAVLPHAIEPIIHAIGVGIPLQFDKRRARAVGWDPDGDRFGRS